MNGKLELIIRRRSTIGERPLWDAGTGNEDTVCL
jgi:hypothetical protein